MSAPSRTRFSLFQLGRFATPCGDRGRLGRHSGDSRRYDRRTGQQPPEHPQMRLVPRSRAPASTCIRTASQMAISSANSSSTSEQTVDPVSRRNSTQAKVSIRITENGQTASGRGRPPIQLLRGRGPHLLRGVARQGSEARTSSVTWLTSHSNPALGYRRSLISINMGSICFKTSLQRLQLLYPISEFGGTA